MAQHAYQQSPAPAPRAVVRTRNPAPLMRIVVTLLGAGATVFGVFLPWIRGTSGFDLSSRALYRPLFIREAPRYVNSVGFVLVALALIALIGLVPRSGWLTRLAGALGIAVFVLFVVELYRVTNGPLPGSGAWVSLAGSAATLIG